MIKEKQMKSKVTAAFETIIPGFLLLILHCGDTLKSWEAIRTASIHEITASAESVRDTEASLRSVDPGDSDF